MYAHTEQRFQFRGKTYRKKKNAVTYFGCVHAIPALRRHKNHTV